LIKNAKHASTADTVHRHAYIARAIVNAMGKTPRPKWRPPDVQVVETVDEARQAILRTEEKKRRKAVLVAKRQAVVPVASGLTKRRRRPTPSDTKPPQKPAATGTAGDHDAELL
jgi:hypothetical protein